MIKNNSYAVVMSSICFVRELYRDCDALNIVGDRVLFLHKNNSYIIDLQMITNDGHLLVMEYDSLDKESIPNLLITKQALYGYTIIEETIY